MKKTIRKQIFSDPKYEGKHILVADDKIYATSDAKKASKLFDEIIRKHKIIPSVTFVPKATSLIIWF